MGITSIMQVFSGYLQLKPAIAPLQVDLHTATELFAPWLRMYATDMP